MRIPCEVCLTIPIVLKRYTYRITSKHFVRRINATNTTFLRLPVVFGKLDCFNKCYCGSSIWPWRLVKKSEKKFFLSNVYKIMIRWKSNSFRILKKAIWLFLPITELLWIGEALPIHLFLCKKLSLFFLNIGRWRSMEGRCWKTGIIPKRDSFSWEKNTKPMWRYIGLPFSAVLSKCGMSVWCAYWVWAACDSWFVMRRRHKLTTAFTDPTL